MATNPFDQFDAPVAKSANPFDQFDPVEKKEEEGAKQLPQSDTSSDFIRALGNQLPQIQETYGAAKVLTGKALDDKEMMQAGLETMKAGQKKQVSKESDELTKAWEAGIGTVLTDWLPYQAGAGVGSLMETLAMMGIGAGVGAVTGAGVGSVPGAIAGGLSKQLVKKGIKEAAEDVIQKELKQQLAEGLTKKEAKEAAKEAGKTFIEAETKKLLADMAGEGAKSAAKKGALAYGSSLGLAGMAGLHGAGEPTSRAIQEEERRAAAEGRQFDVNELDMERLAPAAAVHGLADFIVSKITLGAIKGLPKPSSESFARDVVTHMVKTGGKEVVPEEIQTMAERYGANLSLADAEAMSEYVNTAGAAMVMGAIPGGVGGARTYLAGKQAKNEVKDVVEKDVDTTTKVEDKPAEEVAKETLKDAPTPVAEQAVQSTLNTVPTPELDTKIDEVTTKLKEVEDTIEGGENLSRKDYAAYYRERDSYQAQLDDLLAQKAAAQQTGEATAGQELSALATKIKESEQAPAPVSELDAKIAEVENRLATEDFKHPKHKANVERQLAQLKAQRETQDVTQPDTGAVGVGAEVPVGPAVDINAPTVEAPAVGGLGEVSGAEPVAVRGPEEQQAALEAAAPTAEEAAVEPEVAAEAETAPVAPPTAVQEVKMRRDPSGNDYQVTMDNGQTNFIYRDTSGVWRLDTAGYKVPVESQLGWVSDELGKNKKEALAALPGKLQQLEKYRVQEAPAAKPAPTVKEAKTEKPAPKAKREEGPRTVSRLTAALQGAIQQGTSIRQVLSIVADRGLNDWPSATYAQNLLTLLDRPMGLMKVTFTFGTVGKKADGKFDPNMERITLKGKDGAYTGVRPLDQTILHEVMHYFTDHVVDNMALYLKSVPPTRQAEVKAAYKRLEQNYKRAVAEFGTKYNIGSIKEFIAEVFTNPAFQRDMASLKIGEGQLARVSLFARVAEAIANMLGLAKGTGIALRQSLEDVASLISPVGEVKAKEISYSEPKIAPAIRDDGEIDPRNVENAEAAAAYSAPVDHIPKNVLTSLRRIFFTREGWRRTITNVQNERHAVKSWENKLALAGKIIYDGIKQNAVYTELTRATSLGRNLFNTHIRPLQDKMEKQVYQYAKAAGMTVEQALDSLHRITEALHEPERRLVKYIMTVPLQKRAADRREAIIKRLNTEALTQKEAIKLRAELDAIVFDVDAQGNIVPNTRNIDVIAAGPAINLTNDAYNVTGLSSNAVAERLQKYEASEHKALIDGIVDTMAKMHDQTAELNKKANYWSQPVSNRVNFYGFEHYIPLKGISKHSEADEYLDFDGERLGKELQQMDQSFEGRITVSNNPLLQTMSDAVRASLRAGRKDLTLSIKNAVDQKLIEGKVLKTISFEDRQNKDILAELPRENTIFHYNPDGSIDIIAIYNKDLRESIRRTYRSTNPLIEFSNKVTSTLGQMHTRYNYMFAPINFVRDSLTNAWTLGAELGPKQALNLISAVSANVVNGNMVRKALLISIAYESKDATAINKFRNSNDAYTRNIIEFLEQGGMVEYLQGVSLKSNFQKLHKDIGRGGWSRTKEKIDFVVDIWTDMFEIASRAAAYDVAKQNFLSKGMEEVAAQKKAAAYAKNLANFEQVGKYGKEWGSLFMFFRPAATGAVRAVEALLPAFTPVNKVLAELPRNVREDEAAVAEFRKNYAEQQKNARRMTVALMGAGAFAYMMAYMLADDDDLGRNKVLTDDMSLWNRNFRVHIPGMDKPVQIPWGFGLGAFAAAGAQLAAIANGSQGLGGFFNSLVQLTLDSFLPIPVTRMSVKTGEDIPAAVLDSLIPSILRPMLEFTMNKNGLGNQIYNDTNKRMGDAYLGGDNIPEWYKSLSKYIVESTNGGIDISPNSLYFLGNSYFDGPLRIFDTLTETSYVLAGQKDFDSNLVRKVPILGSFIGSAPNVDAREFASVETQILGMDAKLKMFLANNPEQYVKYIDANPLATAVVSVYNNSVTPLNDLRESANKIRSLPIPAKDKADMLKANKDSQNLIKYHLVNVLKELDVKP